MNIRIQLSALACVVTMAAPAFADELPARKPGLWEATMAGMGAPGGMKIRQCIDAKTDQLAKAGAAPGATCSKNEVKKTAAGYAVASTCTVGGMTVEGKGLITGDFTTAAKVEMTTTMSGVPGQPAGGMPPQTMTIETRRLGDCEAGQKPGDMIMPNGQVIKLPGT